MLTYYDRLETIEPPLVKELLFLPFLHEKTLNLVGRGKKKVALKLTRRSGQQATTEWINLISDFCSG